MCSNSEKFETYERINIHQFKLCDIVKKISLQSTLPNVSEIKSMAIMNRGEQA